MHASDEIVVRTSTMPSEEMVHNAVRLWAAATVRRTAIRTVGISKVNEPDSSSEGVSGSLSDNSNSSLSSMYESDTTLSSSLSGTSEGSISQGSVSLPAATVVPDQEDVTKQEGMQQPVTKAVVQCPWFEAKLGQFPHLHRCAAQLQKEGFDSKETIVYLTVEDMCKIGIPIALRRLLQDLQREVENTLATSSSQ